MHFSENHQECFHMLLLHLFLQNSFCEEALCQNMAKCVPDFSTDQGVCECTGYKGNHCQDLGKAALQQFFQFDVHTLFLVKIVFTLIINAWRKFLIKFTQDLAMKRNHFLKKYGKIDVRINGLYTYFSTLIRGGRRCHAQICRTANSDLPYRPFLHRP